MKRLPIFLVPIALAPAAVLLAQDPPEITSFAVQPGVEVELEFTDTTIGGVRYTLEASENLFGWTEVGSDLPDVRGIGQYALSAPIDEGETQMFFQIRSEPVVATLGFELAAHEVDEGSGPQQISVNFVDGSGSPLIYNGPISYQWSGADDLVGNLTGSVTAGGTSAVIPLVILDNLSTEPLRQLTLKLVPDPSGNYSVDPATASTTLTILENDNYWRGAFVSDGSLLDLEIFIRRNDASLLVLLTDGTALLPEDGLSVTLAATLTESRFHVEFPATAVRSTPENLVAPGTELLLVLNADRDVAGQSVSRDEFAGTGTLTLRNNALPHLTTTSTGTFVLRQDPPLQPVGDLPLE